MKWQSRWMPATSRAFPTVKSHPDRHLTFYTFINFHIRAPWSLRTTVRIDRLASKQRPIFDTFATMVAPTAASIVQAIPSRKRKRQRARPDDADMLTPAATNSGKSRRTTPPATLTPHKYGTRTALHGRDETTYSKYDTKVRQDF